MPVNQLALKENEILSYSPANDFFTVDGSGNISGSYSNAHPGDYLKVTGSDSGFTGEICARSSGICHCNQLVAGLTTTHLIVDTQYNIASGAAGNQYQLVAQPSVLLAAITEGNQGEWEGAWGDGQTATYDWDNAGTSNGDIYVGS